MSSQYEPYYSLIEKDLRRKILKGEYGIGAKLPSENALADQYSVSRMTARQAIMGLVDKGLIDRKRGLGSFVISTKIERQMRAFVGVHEDLANQGLNPTSKTLSTIVRQCAPEEARLLGVRPHEEVVQIERLRFADGLPLGFQRMVIPHSLAPEIDHLDLEHSPFYGYLKEIGKPIVRADQRIESVLDDDVAALMGVPAGIPFLRFEKVSFTEGEVPVELLLSYFRGDKYVFNLALS